MQEIYIKLSIAIGIIVIIDGIALLLKNGRVMDSKLIKVTTNIEFLWALISIVAIFTIPFSGWFYAIPGIYIAHNIPGWVYGSYLLKKHTDAGDSISTFSIPIWYVYFGIFIGVTFMVLSSFAAIEM